MALAIHIVFARKGMVTMFFGQFRSSLNNFKNFIELVNDCLLVLVILQVLFESTSSFRSQHLVLLP